ncbi:MAG: gerBC 1 [Firmicutes bacterium]|nr:gerBC 1 [Bacillota bacterium]
MLIRVILVTLLTTLTLLCSGCYSQKETDSLAYIEVIGIDKAEGGKQKVTYQLAIPRSASGSDASSIMGAKDATSKKTWITNTIIVPAPAEARMLLSSTMPRTPNYKHIVAWIFSEEVAREGLGPSLAYPIRNRDFRDTTYLIIVQGTAEDYIKRNTPTLESTVIKYYETVFTYANNSSYYLPSTIHNFLKRNKNIGGSPYVAYTGINPMTLKDKPAGSKTPEQKGDPYLPGGLPRTGTENPAEFFGLAAFRGDKMVGVLNSDETRAIVLLQGKFIHGYVGVVDPLKPEKDAVNLNIYCDTTPKISADLNNGQAIFDVEVQLEGEILGITSGINYEAPGYRELLETQIANLFKGQITAMIRHTQELGTDPVGFGLYLRPQFSNTTELTQANTTALYQAADIHVNVTAKIRRTGLIWRTTPPRN